MNKEEKEEAGTSGISRREFLKDAGLITGGAALGSIALTSACTASATKTVTKTVTVTSPATTGLSEVSATANVVKLTVNEQDYELQVEAEDTLRDVLRNKIGIFSLKDMCNGYGACGSCTAIVDGRPILTCMALAVQYDGAVIETAEHLADINHPLIDAYIYNYCMQCGYCTPGFVVTAKALLDKNPKPTEEDIRDALTGNLCICGTYPAHIAAVLEASGQAVA
jgi:aerobic-type carbon monoxide dehydrogenase small subunit (CoxS/CutS family)